MANFDISKVRSIEKIFISHSLKIDELAMDYPIIAFIFRAILQLFTKKINTYRDKTKC